LLPKANVEQDSVYW